MHLLQHLPSSIDKVLWALLHRDAAQKGNHLLVLGWHFDVKKLLTQWLHCIVNRGNFIGAYAIFLNYRFASKVAHRDNMVSIIHAIFRNAEHCGINLSTTAVKVGGMNMNYQWLACDLLGMNACRISKPIV